MSPMSAYRRDQRGASTVEFALVLPLFIALTLGVVHMSMVVYAAVNLHDATEYTARCLAVSANTTGGTCPSTSATNVQAYGAGRYTGPNIAPTFTLVSATSCTGSVQQVQGTGTYQVVLGLVNLPITITAKSCFP
jgi:Flp pilus assembly protein TadG